LCAKKYPGAKLGLLLSYVADYRRLHVWRLAQELAVQIYGATRDFPASERFGLASQLRRAAVSVPANLAEGCGRNSDTELKRFANIARGSLHELICELDLCARLNLLDAETAERLTGQAELTGRCLGSLIRAYATMAASSRRRHQKSD
jgi:four helix bundle protein